MAVICATLKNLTVVTLDFKIKYTGEDMIRNRGKVEVYPAGLFPDDPHKADMLLTAAEKKELTDILIKYLRDTRKLIK